MSTTPLSLRSWLVPALLFTVVAAAGSCDRAPKADPLVRPGVLALVDDHAITLEEAQAAVASQPDRDWSEPEARRELVDLLVERRLFIETARARGYERDPEVVRAFESFMASQFERDEYERRVGTEDPTDAEIEAYYRAHLPLWSSRERVRVAAVFVLVEDEESEEEVEEARKRAGDALAAARDLPPSIYDLGQVAVSWSDDRASASKGGDLGWLVRGAPTRLDPAVVEQAFARRDPGDLSPVVRTATGFAFVKLIEREPPETRSLEKVRPAVVTALRRERRETAVRELKEELWRGRTVRKAEDLDSRLEALRVPKREDAPDDDDAGGDLDSESEAMPVSPEILQKIRELSR